MSCRCAECGFLALVEHHSERLVDAKKRYRTEGELPHPPSQSHRPVCFVNSVDLNAEWEAKCRDIRPEANLIKAILAAERRCESFYPWVPEFSPRDHYDMLQQERIQKWQAEREDKDRVWRTTQAKIDHEWRERIDERDREWRKKDQSELAKVLQRERYKGWSIAIWTLFVTVVGWLISLWK